MDAAAVNRVDEHLGPPDASPNFRSLPVANTAQTSHLHVPIVRRAAVVPLRHAAASPPARAARAQDMMPTTTATAAPRPPPSPPPPPSAATAKAPGPGATAALLLPSSPADTRAANTSITETLHILDAFNHRHHNQHRATHWWSSFRILRRRLQSLRDALLSSARAAPPGAVRQRLRCRAGRPSFSQLAADNQHAPLGLLLLAVLGRVDTVLATLAPSDDAKTLPPPAVQSSRANVTTARPMPAETETEAPPPDLGVAVSVKMSRALLSARSALKRARPLTHTKKRSRDVKSEAAGSDTAGKQRQSNKKNKKKSKDGATPLPTSLAHWPDTRDTSKRPISSNY
ncbi:hypothetical protein ACCO45_000680 [Purpureocillium lilacinum]|uniref:Uncharacterized protein n=1 Tax=Purpureocillium lilacinum TaxID=33203 RepID=A0ACC4E4V4_PURLI